MTENELGELARQFESTREHLRAVAYRMLGSRTEADDAVQEAWLRLSRADSSEIDNIGGWLTTVVARVCLDMLRCRKSRGEESLEGALADPVPSRSAGPDPEQELMLGESVSLALLVVLETLTPAERVAFVLHDMFDLSFEEIAPIVKRTPTAARQLASRARRRVRGARASAESDRDRQRQIVDAFLAASRGGDFEALLALLDPDVVLRADAAAVAAGATAEVRGARETAQTFSGRARAAQPALLDGVPGLVWAPGGQPRVAFRFEIRGGKITGIELIADPERLRGMELRVTSSAARNRPT